MTDPPHDPAAAPASAKSVHPPDKPVPPRKKKLSPTLAGFVLVVLMGGVYIVAQLLTHSGPPVDWVRSFDDALRLAKEKNQRIFLYLHEPNCPVTIDRERSLFTQRYARERLARMVCCRIELKPGDPLAARFHFDHAPLIYVLHRDGRMLTDQPVTGDIDQRQFETYIRPE